MRRLALVLLVGVICVAAGFYAGSAACERSRASSAAAALRRANEAMTVGRRDEALEYAFAAVDRDPELTAAYEVAGDAVAQQRRNELAGHFYRAALGGLGKPGATASNASTTSRLELERARIQAKIDALGSAPN
jgi:Tfp pilus assembly protein PilF